MSSSIFFSPDILARADLVMATERSSHCGLLLPEPCSMFSQRFSSALAQSPPKKPMAMFLFSGLITKPITTRVPFTRGRCCFFAQAVAKFLNDRAYSLVHEVILTGFKVCTVNGGGLAQLSSAFQRTGIGDQQRKNVFELPGMRHVVFRYVAGDAQIFVCQRAEFLGRANASTAKMAWTRNPARWRAALQIVANLSSRHVVFIFTTGKLSQRLLLLNRHGSQFHRIFIFLHGIIEDFLLLLAGFPVVDEIRKIEFGALPLEAQRVHHRGERVGGNAVKPGTSIVDGNLVIANVTDISASPYSMISLKDQD